MTQRLSTRWLVGLFAFALIVRLAALAAFQAHKHGVATAHHEHASIAASLAAGNGFRFNFFGPLDQPVLTSQQAPLVPGLLAGCYSIFGIETTAAFLAMLLVQAIVSALTVLGTALLARGLTHSGGVGKSAGLLAAVYPPLIESALHIQALCWNLGWLTLLLCSANDYRQGRTKRGAVGLAAAGIGGLLTDPILGGPIALVVAVLAVETGRRAPLRLVAVAGTIFAGVAPWVVRNYLVHGRFVPIKDSFFYVLWQGNNRVSQGTDKLLVPDGDAQRLASSTHPLQANRLALEVRRRAVSVDSCLDPTFIAELQSLSTEIDRMDRFRTLAVRQIADDPIRYLRRCLRRLEYWLWFDRTNPRSYLWFYRVGYLALVAWALAGVWAVRFDWRNWLPVLAAAAALTAVHVLVITSARFRIPMELLLVLPAGAAIHKFACLFDSVRFSGIAGKVASFSILRLSGRPIQQACTEGPSTARRGLPASIP